MTVFTMIAETVLPAGGATTGWVMTRCRLHKLRREVHLLRAQANDSVTGGPTRAAWESVACARLAAPEPSVLLLGDLDHFKQVNDTLGHPAGDIVLQTMAQRLTTAFAAGQGEVCRLGGDEFGIIATDTGLVGDLDALAESLTAPISLPTGSHVTVGISLGCTRTPRQQAPELSDALAHADEQLLATKRHHHDAAPR